ncbi:MAG: hypothetical protein D6689_15465 [Deltaproteobacteria bacterium]|nr:MAG: hypothetical protein D6689_15465 [Deltaproteobacteria bacterium]
MRRIAPTTLAALAALASVATAFAPARAEQPVAAPAGDVVYAADGALWRIPADGSSEPRRLAMLPAGAGAPTQIIASPNGALVVVVFGEAVGWLQPGDGDRALAWAPCGPPVAVAPDGGGFVCSTAAGPVLQPRAWRAVTVGGGTTAAAWWSADAIAVVRDGALVVEPTAGRARDARVLAAQAPDGPFVLSPDRRRGVGVYANADGERSLYGFALDGRAARRKLGGDATPVAWDGSSRWVLVAEDGYACVVRAVGGEYKCWRRYTPLGFSPDSTYVLLARDGRLFVAPIAGVEAVRPRPVIGADTGAWIAAADN